MYVRTLLTGRKGACAAGVLCAGMLLAPAAVAAVSPPAAPSAVVATPVARSASAVVKIGKPSAARVGGNKVRVTVVKVKAAKVQARFKNGKKTVTKTVKARGGTAGVTLPAKAKNVAVRGVRGSKHSGWKNVHVPKKNTAGTDTTPVNPPAPTPQDPGSPAPTPQDPVVAAPTGVSVSPWSRAAIVASTIPANTADVLYYGIDARYRRVGTSTWNPYPQATRTSGRIGYVAIAGLAANTTYELQTRATWGYPYQGAATDVGPYGPSTQFTTLNTSVEGQPVNVTSTADVTRVYMDYLSAGSTRADFTGNTATCQAGTTSQAYRTDVVNEINVYRRLAGLSSVTENTSTSTEAQSTALMMAAAGAIEHHPTTAWPCYTPQGATTADLSNLAISTGSFNLTAPWSIDVYMKDPGDDNKVKGHRYGVLDSCVLAVGIGDAFSAQASANALELGSNRKPACTRSHAVFPNASYTPIELMQTDWSADFPGTTFTGVTVTRNGTPVTVTQLYNSDGRITWRMPDDVMTTPGVTYQVTLTGTNPITYPVRPITTLTSF